MCASDTSPGLALVPPPISAGIVTYVAGTQVYALDNLRQVYELLSDGETHAPLETKTFVAGRTEDKYHVDFAEVKGQYLRSASRRSTAA